MTETTDNSKKSPEMEAAELLKLNLEIEKLQSELADRIHETEKKRSEAREAVAKALIAEHDAAIRGITRKERQRAEDLLLTSDFYQYTYPFDGPVTKDSVQLCLGAISAWHRQEPESKWHFVINSPGGSAIDGMHLFDTLRTHSLAGGGTHEITMTVRGYAASMAGILLQAVDRRQMGREAWLMIHEITAGTGGKIGEMKDDVKWYEKMCARIADIFVTRSEGKISLDEFKSGWERSDWWLSSDEALNYGFIDAIG